MTATTGERREFTPHPGSVADRALAWLRLQPARAEISTAALAEAINTPAHQLSSSMEQARERGAVFARKKGGHLRSPLFWSLVDHTKATNGSQIPQELASQHVLKAEAARPDATDSDAPANASPDGGPMGVGQPAAAGPAGDHAAPLLGRNATISLTGEVAIVAECGTVILFDAARGQQLRSFFQRTAG